MWLFTHALDVSVSKAYCRIVLKKWKGGPLRLFSRDADGSLREENPGATSEFIPLGKGWAIEPKDLRSHAIRGVVLEFDVRDGALRCVAIRSLPGGPKLSSTFLRKLGPHIRTEELSIFFFRVRRLIELENGEVVAAWPYGKDQPPREGDDPLEWALGDLTAAYDTQRHRPGRPPLLDEHLRRVAELYEEAEALGQPRTAHIARAFPNYSPATIRNWVRQARRRKFLAAVSEREPEGGVSG